MFNAYINDTYDLAYPLFGDGRLPFPNSVLRHISVCIIGDRPPVPVTLSHLFLSEDEVRGTLTRGDELIGSFSLDRSSSGSAATLVPGDSVEASGTVVVGSVPESAYGTYDGAWKLDPSCVSYMPALVRARYSELVVNGVEADLPECLSLACDSASLALSSETNMFIGGFASGDWIVPLDRGGHMAYDKVAAINSMPVPLEAGAQHTLTFAAADNGVQLELGVAGNLILLLVHGTTEFPNCYAKDTDEAKQAEPDNA